MTASFEDIVEGVTLTVPCEMPHHEEGLRGCLPTAGGTVVIEYLHLMQENNHGARATFVVCVGHGAFVRARASQPITCPTCGLASTWDTFVRVAGRIGAQLEEN